MRVISALLGLSMLVAAAHAAPPRELRAEVDAALEAQLRVLERTEALLRDKLDSRRQDVRRRARTTYKLLRAGSAPLWVDARERGRTVRRRAAARRILVRDLYETELLVDELDTVLSARARLQRDRARLEALTLPAPASLHPPAEGRIVRRFGTYTHGSGALLSSSGIELRVSPGAQVRAPSAATVVYAGPLRQLGFGVVLDHGSYYTVLGRVQPTAQAGAHLARGAIVGTATADSLAFEVRLKVGAGGTPIDPAPLLGDP